MDECFVCGDDASFIRTDGGYFMCRQCVHDGKDLA